MTPHATAQARLTGAREQHTLAEPVVAMVEGALNRHPDNCGLRHVLGSPECLSYEEALVVLGIGGAR